MFFSIGLSFCKLVIYENFLKFAFKPVKNELLNILKIGGKPLPLHERQWGRRHW